MFQAARQTLFRAVATSTAVIVTVEVTTHLPSEGRASQTYHDLVDDVITPLMRRYLDPETAHHVAIYCAKRGLAPKYRHSAVEQQTPLGITVLGHTFSNPLGLAAGFDKNGVAIEGMLQSGFGFVEIGSVTPLPQPGNPKPRMFRLPIDLGIINRYGFNSDGLDVVEENLKAFRSPSPIEQEGEDSQSSSKNLHRLSQVIYSINRGIVTAWKFFFPTAFFTPSHIVGVNLGKNKESESEIHDYTTGIHQLGPYANYLVINVSSPNTPGLRSLQAPDRIKDLVTACIAERDELSDRPPLLVKLAPDLSKEELQEIATVLMQCGVDGLIVSNTTNARPASLVSSSKDEMGGLSGLPLKDRATECIRILYAHTEGKLPIIGVGGISNAHDCMEKLKAGASLLQIYSALAYEGPGVVTKMRHELSELIKQQGFRTLDEVIGYSHEEIYWARRKEERLRLSEGEKTYYTEDE